MHGIKEVQRAHSFLSVISKQKYDPSRNNPNTNPTVTCAGPGFVDSTPRNGGVFVLQIDQYLFNTGCIYSHMVYRANRVPTLRIALVLLFLAVVFISH